MLAIISSRPTLGAIFVAFGCVLLLQSPGQSDDAVILNDGFTIQGRVFKERESISFNTSLFSRTAFFDGVERGPNFVFFSGHTKKQLAAIEKDIPTTPMVAYKRQAPGTRGLKPPGIGQLVASEFNERWRRSLKVTTGPGRYQIVEQMVTFLDPQTCYLFSTSHSWRQAYATRELGPVLIRKLLGTHPDLQDPPGKVDPLRRLAITTFMKDAGWLYEARQELAQLKKDFPEPWEKNVVDRFDSVVKTIDEAETEVLLDELQAAIDSGRYDAATNFLKSYQPAVTDAKVLNRLAELKATIEQVQPRYRRTQQLLGQLLDSVTGRAKINLPGAAIGGVLGVDNPLEVLTPEMTTLVEGLSAVYDELHQDSASRLDLFYLVADQEFRRKETGKESTTPIENMMALAITGWLKGKNGAENNPTAALKCWNTRIMAMDYLTERVGNDRTGILNSYVASNNKLPPDELAQIITLLPPVLPEDLSAPRGELISSDKALGIPGLYLRNTGPLAADENGKDYYLRLPDEYHHGRNYPVIIAMTDPLIPEETLVALLANMANKYGYIVAAPKWTSGIPIDPDYSGRDHKIPTTIMRDVFRRFQVDQDKVFLLGFGSGATLAFDVGLSHPDLFAGVIPIGPQIVHQFYQEYWKNAQKLPIYCVTGEFAADSVPQLRKIYDKWLPLGYPAILSVYKGRGVEWYSEELPQIFNWMSRKTRVRGNGSLRLNAKRFDAWQTMRESDKRFYWLEFEEISSRNVFNSSERPERAPVPAQMRGDIRAGNQIIIDDCRGVRKVTIWLEREMIDWNTKVDIRVQYAPRNPPRQIIEPDLRLMFEELYRTGDRKMLFFGKITVDVAS